jgi:hypothetical protein
MRRMLVSAMRSAPGGFVHAVAAQVGWAVLALVVCFEEASGLPRLL